LLASGIRVLLASLALLLSASLAGAQEGVDVESVEFEGNVRYSTENLKFSMRTREGKRFDKDLLARDLAMLRAYFEEISYVEEVGPKGVRLVFRVVENPLVSRVEFVGNEEYLETDLKPLVETRTGYPLAAYKLENDVRVLERRYRDAGYHFIEVRPEVLEDEGARRVVFRITEGPEVEVYDVAFTGNDSLPPGKLKGVMALRPAKLFGSTPFVERRLEEDRIALTKLYRDEGFLDVQVWVDGFDFDESGPPSGSWSRRGAPGPSARSR
jgi:outer membrane protein insertion porin family